MIFQQFYLPCLAHASYIVGDSATGTAAVVDPQRDIDRYIAFATQHALRIKHVFLTHLHADFIAGHLELRDRVGATIYLGAAAKASYAFTPLRDADLIELGRVRLQVLETPGHTPESISILVYDWTPAKRNLMAYSREIPCLSATSGVPTCVRHLAGRRPN